MPEERFLHVQRHVVMTFAGFFVSELPGFEPGPGAQRTPGSICGSIDQVTFNQPRRHTLSRFPCILFLN